jgi:putative spermidine/putrescine transport system substrate-binding protein
MTDMTRRNVTVLLAAAAVHAFPGISMAQGRRFAIASITGSWEVAFREILVPAFKAANNNPDVALDALIGLDQLAKVTASKGNPPLDTMLLDPGPALVAEKQGLVDHFPSERSTHYKDINPNARTQDGVAPFFIFIGLAYNTDKIKTPPTSWTDLWKPEYKGRVGITNLNSTLGTAFLVEAARMRGGSEKNVDEGFKALAELRPNLASVAANPSQAAILFQQGQIDIAPAVFNEIQLLKARDVPVDFVLPKEKGIGYTSTMYITKGSPYQDLAFKFIESVLSPQVQEKMMQEPFLITPTNTKVKFAGEVARVLGVDPAKITEKLVFQDWETINQQRSAWIERFNREIKL